VTEFRRVGLSTGVTLNVAFAGPQDAPAVILLHGFPESHRTWREVAPRLEDEFRLIMPDQRGFAGSDRPEDVAEYAVDKLIDDIFALAEAAGVESFALVGHDWGGAIAWPAALRNDPRLTKLAIVNAPHPLVFQKSLIEDEAQRNASQYINWFRTPGADKAIEAMGFDAFFEKTMANHIPPGSVPDEEKRRYVADWSQGGGMLPMLNWYRASKLVVPPSGVAAPMPEHLLRAFPKIHVPTLVVWGMRDAALLPLQLDGLDDLVDDLRIVKIAGAGHFAPWEAGEQVASALRDFLG